MLHRIPLKLVDVQKNIVIVESPFGKIHSNRS